jgi:xanthine dehydrogenase accessory factor
VKDVLDRVERWLSEGRPVALATVIATERSAPRDPGAVLAAAGGSAAAEFEVAGSVSGGCVEGAVIEEAAEVIRTGRPTRVTYGISDEDAISVGLSCGGIVHIFIERLSPGPLFAALARALRAEAPVALATQTGGDGSGGKMLVATDGTVGGLGDPELDRAVAAAARAMLEQGQTGLRRYGAGSAERRAESAAQVDVFIDSFAPPARMYIFGATTHAAPVARIGKFLGYRVTLCDARAPFATPERVPDADAIVVRWPDEFLAQAPVDRRTAVCVLTRDPKFDIPLLKTVLATTAGYIGVLGSRRTHEARRAALREAGVPEESLDRLHAPIGLDIGARTSEEVAVAIAAQIIAVRYGRTPVPAQGRQRV